MMCRNSVLNEEERLTAIEMDSRKPHLKPSDLEDIATIFDRIRILYKKKDEVSTHPS
jgi:hypothetical protein